MTSLLPSAAPYLVRLAVVAVTALLKISFREMLGRSFAGLLIPVPVWRVACAQPIPSCCARTVPHRSRPSQEEVHAAQAAVLAGVAALFDQHKHLMPGWEGRQLEIV